MPDMGGEPPASEPPAGAPELAPERLVRDDLNLLLEENLFGSNNFMDLGKGRNSITEIDDRLKELLNR
jgi:hypothetical protein